MKVNLLKRLQSVMNRCKTQFNLLHRINPQSLSNQIHKSHNSQTSFYKSVNLHASKKKTVKWIKR